MAFIVATSEKLDQTVYGTGLCYTDEKMGARWWTDECKVNKDIKCCKYTI